MKSIILKVSVALLGVTLSIAEAGTCPGGKCGGGGGTTTKKGAASSLPTVVSIDEESMKVGEKTYLFSSFVKVKVNGESADVTDIKPGMQVMVTSRCIVKGKTKAESMYQATQIVARANTRFADTKKDRDASDS